MIGISSPGKPYFVSSSRSSSSTSSSNSGSSTRSILLRNTTRAGTPTWRAKQDVLAGLRHRAVGGRDDQDRAVHLGGAGDHVLDEVGVARAVDVGVVPLVGLVLDVATAMVTVLVASRTVPPLAMSAYDLKLGQPLGGLHRQDGAGQRGLAVVDVADGADIDVRLCPFEIFPWPFFHLPALDQARRVRCAISSTDRVLHYPHVCRSADTRAADGTRTHDLVLTKDALYQLSYSSRDVTICHQRAALAGQSNAVSAAALVDSLLALYLSAALSHCDFRPDLASLNFCDPSG